MSANAYGCALTIMAKLPHAGACKTRLVPPLTYDQAAALSTCFLRDTARNIASVANADNACGAAAYTPRAQDAELLALFPPNFMFVEQRGVTFGERLYNAATDLFEAGFASVCLIDSDSPTLPGAYLSAAVRRLQRPGDRVVLGPALDGGYYLIGLKAPHSHLFANVPWSTSRVLEQTIERANECGLDVELLPQWYDVDDASALAKLSEEIVFGTAPRGYRACETEAFLRTLAASRGLGIDLENAG